MKDLEKQIEESAKAHISSEYPAYNAKPLLEILFIDGAKSPEAKEYWQQGMFDRKQLNEAIEVGINEGLRKSQQGMYSEEEVRKIALYAAEEAQDRHMDFPYQWFNEWFDKNKK